MRANTYRILSHETIPKQIQIYTPKLKEKENLDDWVMSNSNELRCKVIVRFVEIGE